MKTKSAVSRFFYDMTLSELNRMHSSAILPNISYNSLLYLDLVDMTHNCTVSRLAELLHVTKSAVTIKVRELMNQGLLEKRQCENDKRVFYLRVRPEVVEEYRSYDQALRRATTFVESRFEQKDIDTFCEVLAAFSTSYMSKDQCEHHESTTPNDQPLVGKV